MSNRAKKLRKQLKLENKIRTEKRINTSNQLKLEALNKKKERKKIINNISKKIKQIIAENYDLESLFEKKQIIKPDFPKLNNEDICIKDQQEFYEKNKFVFTKNLTYETTNYYIYTIPSDSEKCIAKMYEEVTNHIYIRDYENKNSETNLQILKNRTETSKKNLETSKIKLINDLKEYLDYQDDYAEYIFKKLPQYTLNIFGLLFSESLISRFKYGEFYEMAEKLHQMRFNLELTHTHIEVEKSSIIFDEINEIYWKEIND